MARLLLLGKPHIWQVVVASLITGHGLFRMPERSWNAQRRRDTCCFCGLQEETANRIFFKHDALEHNRRKLRLALNSEQGKTCECYSFSGERHRYRTGCLN